MVRFLHIFWAYEVKEMKQDDVYDSIYNECGVRRVGGKCYVVGRVFIDSDVDDMMYDTVAPLDDEDIIKCKAELTKAMNDHPTWTFDDELKLCCIISSPYMDIR